MSNSDIGSEDYWFGPLSPGPDPGPHDENTDVVLQFNVGELMVACVERAIEYIRLWLAWLWMKLNQQVLAMRELVEAWSDDPTSAR